MSTTIDQKVVEMRFDNQNFEKNVQTSLSTLDKLKAKLNLTGASKGLENVNAAAKRVDMGGLSSGIDTVHAKFSALQVMGVTALANITNSAINAGKRIVSALTIDPIKTGFQEYETQINAVQTILANTSSKGTTIDQVNAALDELNKYADQTIYNFTEMTRNIGTFTAAGVDLDTSVSAIKGIANLAAVSGSTSQQASTAMYQLSQALASGTVKLQDWNSVVNAGMGGEVFQNALKRTATVMGTNVDALIEKYGSFRESLTRGEWLTTDVLTETLNQFTMAAEEGTEQWEEYKKSLKEKGYTEAQAVEILKMANTATDAATKVKTFTQLWDVLKESAQSGWSQTWKLLVGDFEEAKAILTPLANFLTGFINSMSNARNSLLESALGKNFTGLVNKIKNITDPIKKSADGVKAVVDSVNDYSKVVNEIIGGKWGNGQARWDSLTKAGYDWAHAQNLVNEKLGDSTRHATDYAEAQKKMSESQTELTDANAKYIAKLAKMSEAQLKVKGFTDEQIEAFKELEEVAKKTGIPIEEFIKNADEIDGRYLLINSIKNVGQGLVTVLTSIGEAWRNAFPPMQTDQLFNIIAGIHKLSTYFIVSEETADKLTRTFKGLFAIIDIITTITGGAMKVAFKLLSKLLGMANIDILSFTATLGDMIAGFRDFLFENELVTAALETIAHGIEIVAASIKNMAEEFMALPKVQKFINKIKDAISRLEDIDLSEVGRNIVDGLLGGLNGGVHKAVQAIIDLGTQIIEAIKGVLGIHSPSTEFFEIGTNVIDGLFNGLQNGFSKVVSFFSGLAQKIISFVKNIDLGQILSVAVGGGMLYIIKNMGDLFGSVSNILDGVGDIFEGVGEAVQKFAGTVKAFNSVLKSFSMSIKAKALKEIAIAIAILAAAVIALSFIQPSKLWNAVGVVAALAAVMVALSFAINKMSNASLSLDRGGLNMRGFNTSLIGIGISLLLLAATIKVMGSMNMDQAIQGFVGLAGLITALAVVIATYGLLVKGESAENIDKLGKMLFKLSASLLLITIVIKIIGKLDENELKKGAIAIGAFVGVVALLSAITRLSGNGINKLGWMMLQLSVAMLLMIGVAKLIAGMEWSEMGKAAVGIGGMIIIIGLLTAITMIPGNGLDKLGSTLLAISGAMLILTGIGKIIAGMEWSEMGKAAVGLIGLTAIISALIAVVSIVGNDAPKIALTLLAISVAMGILAAIAIVFGMIKLENLAKGIVAVSMLGAVMALMIRATKDASDCKGTITAMAIAIGVMAGAVAILSFIDTKKLAGATAALSIVMGMFALIVKAGSNMNSSLGALITMTIAVGLLAGMIFLLSKIPIESALSASASLSMLLLSMSVAMTVLSKISNASPRALLAVGVMTLVIGALAGILYLIKDLPIKSTLANTAALSTLLLMMSSSMLILNMIPTISPMALAAVGVMTLVIGALAGILYLIKDLPVESTLANATALSVLLLALSGCCLILSAVGATGPAAFIGVGALLTLIVGVGTLMVAIAALVDKFPKLEEFLNKGIPLLESIGRGLGSFFGGIVGGFMEGAQSGLPGMGTSLSDFMTNVSGFVEGAKNIDESALTGVSMLVDMIKSITGASLTESIVSFITGSSSMDTFATQIISFADAIVAFSNKVKGNINEDAVLAAANAGKLLAELQTSVASTGGVMQFFTGDKDLTVFGTQLTAFGEAIVSFSNKVSEGVNETAVTAAANAGKLMAELQTSIVPTGGVVQFFTGEKDLATFGNQLLAFGDAIVGFSKSVSAEGAINADAVTAAANAGLVMAELQSSIPNAGGVFGFFTGSQDLGTFGSNIKAFGEAIAGFSESVTGIDGDAVSAAANAGSIMAKLQGNLPEDSWFDSKQSLGSFGKQLKKFGEHLADYSEEVSGIDSAAVSTSISLSNRLVAMINNMSGIDTSGVDSFKSAMSSLSTVNIDGFVSAFKSSSSSLSSVGGTMMNSLAKGLTAKKSTVVNAAKSIVTATSKSIASQAGVFTKVGSNLIAKLASGMLSKKSTVKSAAVSSLSGAVNSLRSYYGSFYSAGSYLVSGFASGISANSFRAAAQAAAMANAAEQAAKNALDINSPSKVFRSIGKSVPEGFAMGIGMLGNMVKSSTLSMTDKAIVSTKDAISRVADLMSADIDSEPTIRPVLDLSDIESGAGAINSLLSGTTTVGAMANIGSISTMMNRRIQNGANTDVVSAIDKLRKDLGNIGGTSYTVNGITYDDGSAMSDAVKSIIRAARVERRI